MSGHYEEEDIIHTQPKKLFYSSGNHGQMVAWSAAGGKYR